MTPAALLADLRRRGVTLTLAGTGFRYRAGAGALTDADREALRAQRDGLRALLLKEAACEIFVGATVDPAAGAGRLRDWPSARYGAVPPDFDTLVPARDWLAGGGRQPAPPVVPAAPDDTRALDDERAALLGRAAAVGFPRTPLAPAVCVLPGATAGRSFVQTATADELATAGRALPPTAARVSGRALPPSPAGAADFGDPVAERAALWRGPSGPREGAR
jgi:hypothetical protein